MPKLGTLSGTEVLAMLSGFGFQPFSQLGSHIKVRRTIEQGQTQTLTIPNHREIDRGTLHAIFRQACRFVAEPELRRKFLRAEVGGSEPARFSMEPSRRPGPEERRFVFRYKSVIRQPSAETISQPKNGQTAGAGVAEARPR